MAWVWFKISNLITPIRVPREVEIEGLDMPRWACWATPVSPWIRRRNDLSSTVVEPN